MSTQPQRIEIYPGCTIEVSGRLKQKAGVGRFKLVRDKLDDAERKRILGELVLRGRKNRLYSLLLLDEAAHLSQKVGNRKAAEITGVKYWSVVQRRRELRAAGTIKAKSPYGHAKVKECADLAASLIGTKYTVTVTRTRKHSKHSAFLEAGKRMGMNGRTIKMYAYWGLQGLAQHPSTDKATSGVCAKAANPTAQ